MGYPYLPDVKNVNINHKHSLREATSQHFRDICKERAWWNLFISIATLGIYPYRLYKRARHRVAQAIAARKLFFFNGLRERIEEIRQGQQQTDPRQSINAIFMRVQSEKVSDMEDALEFKAIYSPKELFLFITNPIKERKSMRLYCLNSHAPDYLKMWYELKKKSQINQYRQIQKTNLCNQILKKEFCLTSEGIHDRLTRTIYFRQGPHYLTQFKGLSQAFQDIVIAFQEFEELDESNPQLCHLIKMLAQTSQKDVEILQTYLTNHRLPQNLPIENRKQLIQLGNQQELLYNINTEEQLNFYALILNQYQWEFLLSIQTISERTLHLLDWAFEASPEEIETAPIFSEHIYEGIEKRAKDYPEHFPTLSERIREEPSLDQMTVDFAGELNREWPSFALYKGDATVPSHLVEATESLSIDQLIQIYEMLCAFTEGDQILFCLLQQAVSQEGKNGFQLAIEDGITKILGEKPEYFLPILTNSDVSIFRKSANEIEIHYAFKQIIVKKGEVQHFSERDKRVCIVQSLQRRGNQWISLDPKSKISVAHPKA